MNGGNTENIGVEYRLTNIPEDLWHRFKILCVTEKVSQREKLLELISRELDKQKNI